MNFYALLKLHKRIKSPKLKLLGLGLASVVGFRHLSVRLDPTLRCNLACRMCYFSGEGYKAKAGGLIQRDELEGLVGKTVQNVPLISAKMCHEPRPDFEKIATVMPLSVSVRTVPIISVRIVPFWRAA